MRELARREKLLISNEDGPTRIELFDRESIIFTHQSQEIVLSTSKQGRIEIFTNLGVYEINDKGKVVKIREHDDE